jgi:hypothetical protein
VEKGSHLPFHPQAVIASVSGALAVFAALYSRESLDNHDEQKIPCCLSRFNKAEINPLIFFAAKQGIL